MKKTFLKKPKKGKRKMKLVYFFGNGKAEGKGTLKELLGGKGANLAEMTMLNIPVPAGFTITTEVCNEFYHNGKKLTQTLRSEVLENLKKVEALMGKVFGDKNNPLLVSVRSGARASMPGMMDTILNLGLNDETVKGLIENSGDERFAYDSYRRFIQMYSNVVLNVEHHEFEALIEDVKDKKGYDFDTDLTADDWKGLTQKFKAKVKKQTGTDFPQDPLEQLWGAIKAVFLSWMNKRAIEYRRLHDIPQDWGTAVNVQAMVFGNLGETSATGVAFTRDPSTGEKKFFGEFLVNAQGEDVVAGIRTPRPINKASKNPQDKNKKVSLEELFPSCYKELVAIYRKLERHYRDMQDIEFTIENGKLWMLQTRNGKRTAQAAIKIAVDMVKEKLINEKEAILRVEPGQIDQLLHPMLDPKAKRNIIAHGLPASPGAATGQVVFSSEEAGEEVARGKKVILVRQETSPEDIHGMSISEGILTARGGMTCVAGETKILTNRGFLSAEQGFNLIQQGEQLRILSLDSVSMKPIWQDIVATGRRTSNVITIGISQTGNAENNHLRLTSDHKMYIFEKRKLCKKSLEQVLSDEDFIQVVSDLPTLFETKVTPALAYVVGAIFSDGYICLKPTKGSVTFIQKPTPEKANFITSVEKSFLDAFGVPFSYIRERSEKTQLRGRIIEGSVEDRICFKRDPAARLMEIYENIDRWVLSLDRTALLLFLAGYVDGDGTFSKTSSEVRLQIYISAKEEKLMQGIILACLRLGIVPQVTPNRDSYCIQITEQVDLILAHTQRVQADIRPREQASRCLSLKGLFEDIVDHVNFMGRIREGLKRNIMFGADKIRRDILPLCPGETHRELKAILDSSLRSYRVKQVAEAEPSLVYNFEVDAVDELDKNFVVFSNRLTPILVSNSHAAVVARGMGKCCVVGCGEMNIDEENGCFVTANKTLVRRSDWITLDGSTGEVIKGQVPTTKPELNGDFNKLMMWVDKHRRLKVRTNADTPQDAKLARTFGAEGIGLCRTEHMFFAEERIQAVREMILSSDQTGRERALAKILPMQRKDFEGIFHAMKGFPVTIRLLDPPLHEFLPHTDEELFELAKTMGSSFEELKAKNESLKEFNPMLGHRGCRLGITFPEIYDMQTRAIMEAACFVSQKYRFKITPEIMIPLVGHANELKVIRERVLAVCEGVLAKKKSKMKYLIGTMIELPRAALTADEVALHADFFSFGTNDLTQTTFGLSRDDSQKFLPYYVEHHLLPSDPFVSLDQNGVGELVKIGMQKGHVSKPKLKIGICGEHGGDPASVDFCHEIGLDYVSCSPYRIPIAKLSAAAAALRKRR